MHYAAVLFDLDNTLYDYDAYWHKRLSWALEPVQAAYPALDTAALVARSMREHIYPAQFAAFLQQAGIADSSLCEAATERYRINHYEQLRLYADTLPVLHTLRARCKLGLITNGPTRTQYPKIEQFALASLMDVLLVSEEVGSAKPDPAIFHLALRELGVAPARALYVGDSLESDLRGAEAAGLDFVWMNTRQRVLPPDMPPPLATIEQLSALLSLPQLACAAG
jgi:HAD superfamily hydrolase (TIGR01549 family)